MCTSPNLFDNLNNSTLGLCPAIASTRQPNSAGHVRTRSWTVATGDKTVRTAWEIRQCDTADPLYQIRDEMNDILKSPGAQSLRSTISRQSNSVQSQTCQNVANALVPDDIPGPSVASPDEIDLLQKLSENVDQVLHDPFEPQAELPHTSSNVLKRSCTRLDTEKKLVKKHLDRTTFYTKCGRANLGGLLQSASRMTVEANALAKLFDIRLEDAKAPSMEQQSVNDPCSPVNGSMAMSQNDRTPTRSSSRRCPSSSWYRT